VLQRETRGTKLPSRPQRYLLALSRGASSTALLHILSENVRRQRERNQRAKFELVVVFVDVDVDERTTKSSAADLGSAPATAAAVPSISADKTAHDNADGDVATATSPNLASTSSPSTDPFITHFPDIPIHRLPLSSILSSRTIDWSSLPPQNPDPSLSPSQRLGDFFSRLPSPSARADVSRLLIRHALFAAAAAHDCAVVLLGYNTTALAELTLSEAAKGRGFGIPWLVNDGAFPLPRDPSIGELDVDLPAETTTTTTTAPKSASSTATDDRVFLRGTAGDGGSIPIYSPLREIFRKEILTYLSLSTSSPGGPLSDLFFPSSSSSPRTNRTAAVVSHRDLSLDDVVARFFVDVEASYPSVVANVVRTTGKLNRSRTAHIHTNADIVPDTEGTGLQCGLCGVRRDPFGDERWKGEIGEADTATTIGIVDDNGATEGAGKRTGLCYGCERSVKG
jgi:cytoplasmic tRNA 2-thiolation protein 2